MEIEIQLMNIPGSVADWRRSLEVPEGELPRLTDEQRSIARDFGISEEEYARSVWSRQRSEALYKRYAKYFGDSLLKAGLPRDVRAVEVTYDGWANKFYCRMTRKGGETVPLVVDASIIIESLERGDEQGLAEAKKRIKHAAEWAFRPAAQVGARESSSKRR